MFLQRLYEEEQENSTVMNGVHDGDEYPQREIHEKDVVESLENGVQFWTDFSKVHYHPQSLYELSGLWMDVQEFDNYGIGRDAFSAGLRGEEIGERLRFFVEECDHIQVYLIMSFSFLRCYSLFNLQKFLTRINFRTKGFV